MGYLIFFNTFKNILIMRASVSSLWYKMCTKDYLTNMAVHIDENFFFDAL
jgi:hypothetical protein